MTAAGSAHLANSEKPDPDLGTTIPVWALALVTVQMWAGAAAGVALGAGAVLASAIALWVLATAVAGWVALHGLVRARVRPVGVAARQVVVVTALVGLLFACTATGLGAARRAARDDAPVAVLAASASVVDVEATITSDPQPVPALFPGTKPSTRVLVEVHLVKQSSQVIVGNGQVDVRGSDPAWAQLKWGDQIRATLRLAPQDRLGPTSARGSAVGAPELIAQAPVPLRAAEAMRAGLRASVAHLPPDAAGLLPGLVLGDTTALPDDLVAAMKLAGLSHLTAVSGANVAIVVATVLACARRLRVRRRYLGWLSLATIIGFVILARPQPSVLRASVTAALAVVALMAGRGVPGGLTPETAAQRLLRAAGWAGAGLRLLLVGTLLLLLVDPWLSLSWGFALSVAATAGLLLLAAPFTTATAQLTERLIRVLDGDPAAEPAPGWWPRLRHAGASVVARLLTVVLAASAVTMAAQVTTAPLITAMGAGISLAALPANLLALPAVPLATVCGVAAAALSPVAPIVAVPIATLGGLAASWIARVARWGAVLPLGKLPWPSGAPGALLLITTSVVGLLAVVVLRRAVRRAAVPRRAVVLSLALVLAAATPLARVGAGAWPPAGTLLLACDVGQGDALVLPVDAAEHEVVVVDVGPDPAALANCLRRVGVTRIRLLVLTHFHVDHIGGLDGVDLPVDGLLVSPFAQPAPGAARVRSWATQHGVPELAAEPGRRSTIGELTLLVLWPQGDPPQEGSPPNNASVVLLAERHGTRMLLCGDVEQYAQEGVLRALERTGAVEVDVLKVAHHGSAQVLPSWTARLHPRAGVISVGRHNRYGHPARSTLAELARVGTLVRRTDTDGDIAVVETNGTLTLANRIDPGAR